MASKRCKKTCILFLTLPLPTVLITETYLLLHNTNARWTSTKQPLETRPMRIVVCVRETQALTRYARPCRRIAPLLPRRRLAFCILLPVFHVNGCSWIASDCPWVLETMRTSPRPSESSL